LAITSTGGTVNLGTEDAKGNYSAPGNKLTINNVSGSANYVFNSDLTNKVSDQLIVNSATDSTANTAQIKFDANANLGKNINGSTHLIEAPSNFGLTGKEGQIGAYTYDPNLVYENGWWDLNGLKIAGASDTAKSIESSSNVDLAQWRIANNAMDKRLYSLRQQAEGSGLWANIERNKLTVDGIDNSTYTATVGIDKAIATAQGDVWHVGGAFGYTDGDNAYVTGTGTSKAYTLGMYGGWQNHKGNFLDIMLQGGRLSNDFTMPMNDYQSKGDYRQWGLAASVKYGLHKEVHGNSYWEPYAQLGYNSLNGSNFTTSDNINVNQEAAHSFYGKLGLGYGHKLGKGIIHADVAVGHEFAGSTGTVFESNGLAPIAVNSDVKGTWVDFTLGYKGKIKNNLAWYGDIGRVSMGGGTFSLIMLVILFGVARQFLLSSRCRV